MASGRWFNSEGLFIILAVSVLVDFLKAFLAIFVAVDVVAILPIFLSFVEGLSHEERRRVVVRSTLAATVTGLTFILVGRPLFNLMGITIPDFQIGGGLVLIALAIFDIVVGKEKRKAPRGELGIVPLGIPLVTGPATLTTVVALSDLYGYPVVIGAFLLNMAVVFGVFWGGERLGRLIGPGGARAISKIMMIILAAIGVAMIRNGILGIQRSLFQ